MTQPLTVDIPIAGAGSPLTIALEPGKIIFVVGGNGSGKSALVDYLVRQIPDDRFTRIAAHRQNWTAHDAAQVTPGQRPQTRRHQAEW